MFKLSQNLLVNTDSSQGTDWSTCLSEQKNSQNTAGCSYFSPQNISQKMRKMKVVLCCCKQSKQQANATVILGLRLFLPGMRSKLTSFIKKTQMQ